MRILWLAPWFRTLAEVWAQPLRAAGHEVLVVTSERHYEPVRSSMPEQLLRYGPRQVAGWSEVRSLRRAVAQLEPDVVVTEEIRDPRLCLLARDRPLVLLVHDARPHDDRHRVPWQRRVVGLDLARRTSRRVAFSEAVRDLLPAGAPVSVVPLPSEMPDDLVPPFVQADGRRDVVLVGRLNPYKNLPVVMEAWSRHVASPSYRGDTLVLLGDGEVDAPLAPATEWRRERFAFAEAAGTVAAAKASLAVYRAGSQSGVALWAMQVGTTPLVSQVGGLPEYLPPGVRPLAPTDVDGLTVALGRLADPVVAADQGRHSKIHYESRFSAAISAAELAVVLSDVCVPARAPK